MKYEFEILLPAADPDAAVSGRNSFVTVKEWKLKETGSKIMLYQPSEERRWPMSIGEKIKNLRLSESLSQEQFAEKLAVSRSAVAKWETDSGMPDIENLIAIAREFSVSIDELLSVSQETRADSGGHPKIRIEVFYD